jgi:hypothetical protein
MNKLYPILKAHPNDYEKWLENLEAEGWHLEKVSFGGWLHSFSKCQAKKYKYCYDFQLKIKDEYETIFKDAGWELVYSFAKNYIWRMEYSDTYPDAYNDIESIIAKNNRFILLLIPLLVVYPLNIHNFDLRAPLSVLIYSFLSFFYIIALLIFFRLLYVNAKMKKLLKK